MHTFKCAVCRCVVSKVLKIFFPESSRYKHQLQAAGTTYNLNAQRSTLKGNQYRRGTKGSGQSRPQTPSETKGQGL
eukprot:scaffold226368_cov26-Tisochrysis_lutea.AAC.1